MEKAKMTRVTKKSLLGQKVNSELPKEVIVEKEKKKKGYGLENNDILVGVRG